MAGRPGRLKADEAWGKISPEKKHEFLATHGLLDRAAPDLATPEKIVESLSACGIGQWRDSALALPARVDAALQDAAVEIEPKTQSDHHPAPHAAQRGGFGRLAGRGARSPLRRAWRTALFCRRPEP